MPFKVIHIVDSISKINFGIWHAAVFGSNYLHAEAGAESLLLVCSPKGEETADVSVPVIFLGKDAEHQQGISSVISEKNLETKNTIWVTHGCWLSPTRMGRFVKSLGYRWIYTPHGMLEPWSMQQKALKKKIYFLLLEKRIAANADAIRAVSTREAANLTEIFKRPIVKIGNGTVMPPSSDKPADNIVFLFMARLHHKKGILPLVQAWKKVMSTSPAKLVIAGPDEGEVEKIKPFLGGNIVYKGPVYGEEKKNLLTTAHYFVLPSFSEGFPTSVVEAMSYGLIPVISEGCNFPEVFADDLGYRMEPNETSIEAVLQKIKTQPFDNALSTRNIEFIESNYSERVVGAQLKDLYLQVLASTGKN